MKTANIKWMRPGWQTITTDGVALSVGDVGEVDTTRLERCREGVDYTLEATKPKPKPKPKTTKDPDAGEGI